MTAESSVESEAVVETFDRDVCCVCRCVSGGLGVPGIGIKHPRAAHHPNTGAGGH